MEGIGMLATEMDRIMQEYRRLRAVVPLGSIRTKKEYERAVGLLDGILDEIGENEEHPMAELADAISVFVERYEAEHSPIPTGKPADVLRFLMAEHGLRQSDFADIGSQGVISELLAGRRELNTRQIRKLAKRFGVSPAVFV
jgi:HTH-type transcriptional regulator / antitoxin HigA